MQKGHRRDCAGIAARNPGGLLPTSDKHVRDEAGNRVFRSVLDGHQALLFDLATKVDGRLSPGSTLLDLVTAYHLKPMTAKVWARFLKSAMHNPAIQPHSVLTDLLEVPDNG